MNLSPEFVLQCGLAIAGGAISVYVAIRADLARMHERINNAAISAARSHERIDQHLEQHHA